MFYRKLSIILLCVCEWFGKISRNALHAAVVEKHCLVEDAMEDPDVSASGKEAIALVMCI